MIDLTPEKTCLKKGVKPKWLAMLNDPATKKAKRTLRTYDGSMCCLGVLAECQGDLIVRGRDGEDGLFSIAFKTEAGCLVSEGYGVTTATLTDEHLTRYGLSGEDHNTLYTLNDETETFREVIAMIEALPSEDDL